jgi:pyruvate dehydrogenase (quinone)
VIAELDSVLPADAHLAVDVGSCTYWYARQLRLSGGVSAHVSGTLASMGCAIPYGIAAKVVDSGRPVIALAGDGAMQMSGMSELVTVARAWTAWRDPRFVVCVFNNRDLAAVSWEQRETEGSPRVAITQDLPDVRYADIAAVLGLAGRRVEEPGELGEAWAVALAADRPYVLDIVTDPAMPLLPPFPVGRSKAETMRTALTAEGEAGRRALALLETYVKQETSERT